MVIVNIILTKIVSGKTIRRTKPYLDILFFQQICIPDPMVLTLRFVQVRTF